MTDDERKIIRVLRKQGLGYKKIANETGVSVNTVKTFIKREEAKTINKSCCLNCGETIVQQLHKKQRKFCSDKCRSEWWTKHPENRKEMPYSHTCLYCGKVFSSDRPVSQYCSISCFAEARRGVEKS